MRDVPDCARHRLAAWMLGLTIVAATFSGVRCSSAQDPETGRVSGDLLALQEAFGNHLAEGGTAATFVPPDSTMRLDSVYVLIDADATTSGDDLLDALEALGLRDGAAHGRMVSGWFPIAALERADALETLHRMWASRPQTAGRGE